jgi:LysR family glycine cleavage system transcriptional activator
LNEANLSQLADELFLHTSWGSSFASPPNWKDWFASAGIQRAPNIALGHQIGMSSIALEYARLDMGVILGQRQLATNDIRQNRLSLLSEQSLPLSHAYSAVHPHSRIRHGDLQVLLEMLTDETD